LLELSTGSERLSAARHRDAVEDLAFSPGGDMLASASADGTIRVWAVDLDDLIMLARTKVSRTLTDSECRRFLHASSCSD
jgi:WD40 repeat protein